MEKKYSRDIKNQRPSNISGFNFSCLQIAYPARWDERDARFLKFRMQFKSYLFTVRCLSDDYKLIAIVRSCNEASTCLHCLLQLPSLDPPPCNSPPLITSWVYRRPINPSTVLLNLSPKIHPNPSSNPHTFTCTHSSRGSSPIFNIQIFWRIEATHQSAATTTTEKGERKNSRVTPPCKWLCPKFLIFLPSRLRLWTSRPIEILGQRRIGMRVKRG